MPIYEALPAPRFTLGIVDGQEQIIIPAQRNWPIMIFLVFWFGAWTHAGLSAMGTLLSGKGGVFLVFWLGLWAVAEGFVAATLVWQLSGAEVLRMRGADLEVVTRILWLERTKRFRGSDIRGLKACMPLPRRDWPPFPALGPGHGSVRFTYGSRTVFVAGALDEAEGRLIVDRLRRRLPSSTTA